MIKLFTNIWPERQLITTAEFTEDYVKKLLDLSRVETSILFDENKLFNLIMLSIATDLYDYLAEHNINSRVGIIENYSRNYPGWMLILEVDNIPGTINPLVAKYFNWDRIETQSILSFDELIQQ